MITKKHRSLMYGTDYISWKSALYIKRSAAYAPRAACHYDEWMVIPLSSGNMGKTGTNGGYGLFMIYPPDYDTFSKKQVRILAGCRDFTMAEALKHWRNADSRDARPHFLPLLKAGKEIAKSYGWRL